MPSDSDERPQRKARPSGGLDRDPASPEVRLPSRAEMSRAVQTITGTSPTSDVNVPREGVKLTPAQVQAITRLGDENDAEIRGTEDDGTVVVLVSGKTVRIDSEGRPSSPA